MTKKDFEEKMAELRKNYMNNTIKNFEEKYNKEYIRLFKELNYDIKMRIKRYADDKGNIRVTYLNKIKSDLNDEMMRFNKEWGTLHKTLLEDASKRAFSDTKNLYSDMNMDMLSDQIKWNKDIMDYLINYEAQDGLTISKRLWGHSQSIKHGLMDRISRNIMTGETVWDTMMELQQIKTPNVTIPKYLEDDFKKMNFEEIEKTIDLYTVKKANYITQRLVEAETERAYRTTNLKLSEDKKWVKAMKWNLSAKHNYGEKCSCEDNAEKDNFGMGKGVYPIKYYPHTPAHPWCKCYDTEVFTDECINEVIKNNSQKNDIIENGNDKQNTIKDDKKHEDTMSLPITTTFRKHVPKEYADKIETILNKSPKECIDVWNKYENKINVADSAYNGTAYYSPENNYIKFNIEKDGTNNFGKDTTVFHELGHLFDRNSGELSKTYKNGLFEKTLIEETNDYVDKIKKKLELTSGTKVYKKDAYNEVAREISALSDDICADISDIFEGATTRKIQTRIGHGKTYWENHTVSSEAFAEMYSASINNPGSLKQIKKYLPKSYDVFLKILKEMII